MKLQPKPKKLFLLTTLWLFLALVFSISFAGLFDHSAKSKVEAATSSTINFQARLLTNTGALVPDGFYNIEFKLYNVDSGGTAQWTETYYDSNGVTAGNDNRVRVVNGYLSVYLGSQTPLPNIDWDQEEWLTLNIGGTTQTATPTWDGEMSPRVKLSAVPYAFRAGQLAKLTGSDTSTLDFATQTGARSILLPDESGTLCIQGSTNCGFAAGSGDADYIQNGTSPQTADFNITGAGTIGGTFTANGTSLFKPSSDSTTAFQIQKSDSTPLFVVDTTNSRIAIGPSAVPANSILTVGTNTTAASGGITFGTDTNLYRSAANRLRTDDSFVINGSAGVGTNPVTNVKLAVLNSSTVTSSSVVAGVNGAVVGSPSADSLADFIGGWFQASASTAHNFDTIQGVEGDAYNFSGTVALGIGAYGFYQNASGSAATTTTGVGTHGEVSNQTGGTMTDAIALRGRIRNFGTSLTNAYGLQIETATDPGGTLENNYGVYIQDQSGVGTTSSYNFYSEGATAQNYIEGLLQVGSSDTSARINIGTSSDTTAAGGILLGSDTTLYRSAASTLKTDGGLIVGTLGTGGNVALCSNSGQISTCSTGTGSPFIQGGNSFGGTAILGTNDTNSLAFETDGTTRWLIDATGNFLPNVDDTYDIGSDTARVRNLYLGGETLHVGTSTTDEGTLSYTTSTNLLTLGNQASSSNGGVLIKNAANTTTAFQIQDQAGTSNLFVADTTNTRIGLGIAPATTAGLGLLQVGAASSTTAAQGISFGNDTSANLYRSASATIRTDGSLLVGSAVTAGSDITARNGGAGQTQIGAVVSGNAGILLGSAGDTNLYRNGSAGELKTDGNLTVAGTITSPGAGASSEHFGASSTTGSATFSLAVGTSATVSGNFGTAIGANASSTGSSLAVGRSATATGSRTTAIGESAQATHNFSIALGEGAVTTAANQFIVGSGGSIIGQAYIGAGVTYTAPTQVTLNATGGSGTDIAGATLNLAGGKGTGAGNGGDVNIQIAKPGTTGTSLNTLASVASFSGVNGAALFQNSADSTTAFQIQDAAGTSNAFVVDTTNTKVGIGQTPSSGGSALQVTGGIAATTGNITISANTAQFVATSAVNSGTTIFSGSVSGDSSNKRFTIQASGQLNWGDGTNARDTNLYRLSANVLTTDDAFSVNNDSIYLSTSGDLYATGRISTESGSDTGPRAALDQSAGGANKAGVLFGSGTGAADTNLYRDSASVLKTDDDFITAGDITIQGGDLLTNQTTFNLLNATATTINFGGAATTAINIGPGSNTATSINIAGGSGNTGCTVDGATGNLTCTGNIISGSNQAFVQGGNSMGTTAVLGTNDANDLAFETGGTTRWLINTSGHLLPNANDTYDIGSDTARVRDLYLGGETLHIGTSTTDEGTLSYTTSTNLLTLGNQASSSNGGVLIKNAADSTSAFQIQNAAGTAIYTVNTTNSFIINNASTPAGNLLENPGFEAGITTTNASGWTLNSNTAITNNSANAHSGNYELVLSAASAGATSTKYFQVEGGKSYYASAWVKNSAGAAGAAGSVGILWYDKDKSLLSGDFNIFSAVGTTYTLKEAFDSAPTNAVYARVTVGNGTGATGTWYFDDVTFLKNSYESPMLFQNATDSATAFQIQSSVGGWLFTADTTNETIGIGTAAVASTKLLVQTAKVGLVVNETSTNDILRLQNNGTNVVTVGSTGATIFKNSTDSTTAFQIQNQAGTSNLFVADTTNSRIGLGVTPITTSGSGLLQVGAASSTTAAQGISFGGDVSANIYRSASGYIWSDGNIGATGTIGSNSYLWASANSDNFLYLNHTGATSKKAQIVFQDDGTNTWQIGADVNGTGGQTFDIYDSAAGATRLSVTSTGRVQISTPGTSTDTPLDLNPSDASTSSVAYMQVAGRARYGYNNGFIAIDDNGSDKGFKVGLNGGTPFQMAATSGATLFQNNTNSTTAFQIQDSSSNPLLVADTTNMTLSVRAKSGQAADILRVEDNGGTAYFSVGSAGGVLSRRTGAGPTTSAYAARGLSDSANRISIQAGGTIEWGDGSSAADTQLFRSAANKLQLGIDDDLDVRNTAGDFVSLVSATDSSYLQFYNTSAASEWLMASFVGAETEPRFLVDVNGKISWGDGAGTVDTNLYRSGSSTLQTDSTLTVNSNLYATGTISTELLADSGTRASLDQSAGGANKAGIVLGSGTGAGDTNLYRDSASVLKTDDALTVSGLLTGNAGLTITGGTANINATGTAAVNIGNTSGGAVSIQSQNFVVINPGGASNTGLIISPSNNSTAAVQIQNAASNTIFNVDTSTTPNVVSNPSVEVNTTGISAVGGASLSRITSQQYSGVAALQIGTTATNPSGATFTASGASNTWTISAYVKGASNYSTVILRYNATNCLTGQSVSSSGWTRLTCTTSAGTTLTSVSVLDTTTGHTLYVDGVQAQTGSSVTPFQLGEIALNGVIESPVAFKNQSDSTTAFQIQNTAGTSNLLVADTLNSKIAIGATPSSAGNMGILQVGASGATSQTGGITFGGDVSANIYRSASGYIWSDGNIGATGTIGSNSYLWASANSDNFLYLNHTGATSKKAQIVFQDDGTNTWQIGADINGTGGQTFDLYDSAASATRLSVNSIGQLNNKGAGTNGGGGRLAFGDYDPSTGNTAWIGEYNNGVTADTDILQLNGSSGIYFTTGSLTSPTRVASIFNDGSVKFQNKTDSANAFEIQDQGGTDIFNVDTTSDIIKIGAASADTTGTLLQVDKDTDAAYSAGSATNSATEADGAIFYSTTNHTFMCGVAGSWETCTGLLYSNTAASTAINSCTTACAAFNSNVSTAIPANYCKPGRTIHITARGVHSTTGTPTLQFGVFYGTDATTRTNDVQIGASSGAVTTASGASNLGWSVEFDVVCWSTTSMNGQGEAKVATSATATTTSLMYNNGATAGLTTTSAKSLYIFPTWSANSSSNTITAQQFIISGK